MYVSIQICIHLVQFRVSFWSGGMYLRKGRGMGLEMYHVYFKKKNSKLRSNCMVKLNMKLHMSYWNPFPNFKDVRKLTIWSILNFFKSSLHYHLDYHRSSRAIRRKQSIGSFKIIHYVNLKKIEKFPPILLFRTPWPLCSNTMLYSSQKLLWKSNKIY